jgi:hypothetical protein
MLYDIKDYSYARANQIGVIIRPSEKKHKKIDVFDKQGEYITSIGAKSMSDFPTYVETHGIEFANERRKRFYQRFNNIIKGTTLWYASVILW